MIDTTTKPFNHVMAHLKDGSNTLIGGKDPIVALAHSPLINATGG